MKSELNNTTKKILQDTQEMLLKNNPNSIKSVTDSKENLNLMLDVAKKIQESFQEESVQEMVNIFYMVSLDGFRKMF